MSEIDYFQLGYQYFKSEDFCDHNEGRSDFDTEHGKTVRYGTKEYDEASSQWCKGWLAAKKEFYEKHKPIFDNLEKAAKEFLNLPCWPKGVLGHPSWPLGDLEITFL